MIRRAKSKDIDQLVVLCAEYYENLPHSKVVPMDSEHMRAIIEATLERGIAQVAVEGDKVLGMMLMILSPYLVNPKFMSASDWVFYVSPEARNKGYGSRLIKQCEHVAKQQGVTFFNLAHMGGKAAEALYVQGGYDKTETLFTKEL